MRSEALQSLLAEYEAQRAQNEAENRRRLAEVCAIPELDQLVDARQEMIFQGMRGILDGSAAGEDLPARMESLNARLSDALARHGFAPDYLEPVYRCPICHDTGYVGDPIREMCPCLRQRLHERMAAPAGDASEESFATWNGALYSDEAEPGQTLSPRRMAQFAMESCRDWAEKYPRTAQRDLLITGRSGLGKTFLLHAIARHLAERGVEAVTVSAFALVNAYRRMVFEDDGAEYGEYLKAPVLLIDDLGSEPILKNVSVEQFFYLLNERQSAGLPTVISTNLSDANLQNTYTERVFSRLTDRQNVLRVPLIGTDIRKERRA